MADQARALRQALGGISLPSCRGMVDPWRPHAVYFATGVSLEG